jgi:hypothetical protein
MKKITIVPKSGDPVRPAAGTAHQTATEIQIWPIDKLVHYARNPRKNDAAVYLMCGSILGIYLLG